MWRGAGQYGISGRDLTCYTMHQRWHSLFRNTFRTLELVLASAASLLAYRHLLLHTIRYESQPRDNIRCDLAASIRIIVGSYDLEGPPGSPWRCCNREAVFCIRIGRRQTARNSRVQSTIRP
jgi:hypothetical protein